MPRQTPYGVNPTDSSKQTIVESTIKGSQYSNASCPVNEVVTKRPTYVNINKVGTYAFLYESTASVGGTTVTEAYVTGSVVQNANAGGIKLDISPVAWRRCDDSDAKGDITFVYVRVG